MDVALHWVETVWTKQSRGGKEAARRNAPPVAFPLPDDAPPFVHVVEMHERNGFVPHASVARNLPEGVCLDEENALYDLWADADALADVEKANAPFRRAATGMGGDARRARPVYP